MRSKHVLLKLPPKSVLGVLVVILVGQHVLAVCPPICSCTRSHREVDCSWRGLRQLPDGLQHNMRSLNVSHNRFHNLDNQLGMHTHLRVLDLSHNRLSHLPMGLPRSLWQIYAASNRLQLLDKNDTVHQWNLQTLDLSNNKLERAIFINNTLTNLRTLNLSHNNFWTLPTNMPTNLEVADLSHNLLVQVLPGSLDRLSTLTYFYLHANQFSMLPVHVLDKMISLRVINLGNNPWACHVHSDISYLLSWTQHTPAQVLGCPCHTQSVCGGVHPSRTAGWHFASFNLPALEANAHGLGSDTSKVSVPEWWSDPALLITSNTPRQGYTSNTHLSANIGPTASDHTLHTHSPPVPGTDQDSPADSLLHPDTSSVGADVTLTTESFFTTDASFLQTKRTTTLRTRSVRRQNQSHPSGANSSPPLTTCPSLPLLHSLGLMLLTLQHVL